MVCSPLRTGMTTSTVAAPLGVDGENGGICEMSGTGSKRTQQAGGGEVHTDRGCFGEEDCWKIVARKPRPGSVKPGGGREFYTAGHAGARP